jgi:putative copper export protein
MAYGSTTLDGRALVQAACTWLALLSLAFWAGGLLWQTWLLPLSASPDAELARAAALAYRRFRRLVPWALALLVIADLGIALDLAAELAGTWSGAFSLSLLHAILFGSGFGAFWWLRQAIALAALALMLYARAHGLAFERARDTQVLARKPAPGDTGALAGVSRLSDISDWRLALREPLRSMNRLPRYLVDGLRTRTTVGLAECLLAGLLVLACALSGHAAAVPASQFFSAVVVDFISLAAGVSWIGGLLYVGLALLPALTELSPRARASTLARGFPRFTSLAIVAGILLAVTAIFSVAINLTYWQQLIATAYGRVLFVTVELFLLLAAFGAYHTSWLRPQLTRTLLEEAAATPTDSALVAALPSHAVNTTIATHPAAGEAEPPISAPDALPTRASTLADRLDSWLRREALLGGLLLACVALLGAFDRPLVAPTGAAAPPARAARNAYIHTSVSGGYTLTLVVDPASFGTNTFTVTVADAHAKPVGGASVSITTDMLDMDMGQQTTQLMASTSHLGAYSGTADLSMAGHWKVIVRVLPTATSQPLASTFTFTANY